MSDDPQADPFAPPELSTEVCCIHCGETYDSWQIEWRVESGANGEERGCWCCPMPGCDGIGFGFDILPTDPHYQDERGGWVYDSDDDSEDDGGEWHEADDLTPEETLSADLFSDEPTVEPPGDLPEQRDDWPFSMN